MRKHLVRSRNWNEFDGYLFDIDGTLLNCSDAIHYFAFCDALQLISGRALNLDGVVAHGNTDMGILRDALRLAGIEDAKWRHRIPELQSSMCGFVEAHQQELCVNPLPAVREVLDHLKSRGATLGIATGNLERIGRKKLQHAGLLEYFSVAGWSDSYENRSDVFCNAVAQMRCAISDDASVCFVGDTPADVRAARKNHVPVIAVATGIYSQVQLQSHHPDLCLPSFTELFCLDEKSASDRK